MKQQLNLSRYRMNHTSQNGESGVIEKLLEIMNVTSGYMVEFGAHTGPYLSNSWHSLTKNSNFSTIQIEENPDRFNELKENILTIPGIEYTVINGKVEVEGPNSLNTIFEDVGVTEIALLSIDIDGDDLEIWLSLDTTKYRPAIVVIEESRWKEEQGLNELNDSFAIKGYTLVHVTGNFIFVDNKYGINPILNIHQLCRLSGNPEFMYHYNQIDEAKYQELIKELPGTDIHIRLAGEQIIEF